MQDMNQLNHELMIQDVSSNALTEVALGLSMAFFALLVLALVSIAIPSNLTKPTQKNEIQSIKPEIASGSATADERIKAIFVFYFKGQLVDQNMRPLTFQTLKKGQAVILSLDPDISFQEVIKLQANLSHVDLRMTTLSDAWKTSLSNKFSGN